MSVQKPISLDDVLQAAYHDSYRAYLRTLRDGLGKMDLNGVELPSGRGRPPWWPPFWPGAPSPTGGTGGGPPEGFPGPPAAPPSPDPVKFQ